jgi:cytochrome c peroxidase
MIKKGKTLKWLVSFSTVFLFVNFAEQKSPIPYTFPKLDFFPKMPVSESNPVTVEGVELGKFLFYDPILSKDSTISCSTCHKQEAAFSDSPKDFSLGITGDKMVRNTMPLFNLAWYPSLFWDGKSTSIEEQVFHPVRTHTEMNLQWKEAEKRISKSKFYKKLFKTAFGDQKIDSTLISKAIAQFERTFISHNSKYDRVFRGEEKFSPDELKGFELVNDMRKGGCFHCHSSDGNALGTTLKFSNNGLDSITDPMLYADKGQGCVTGKVSDNGKFKIPSIRNLVFTAPYMHDGRFKTLEEVLDFYSEGVKMSPNIDSKMEFAHQGGARLNCEEKKQIIAFLITMTDSVFVSDPKFGNPFIKR